SAGFGDDSLSVGWKLPDGTLEQPIPASRLRPFGKPETNAPVILGQPINLTVLENLPAVFRVGVSNLGVVSYQWQRNSNNIPGAIGGSYTLMAATNDNGARF